MIKRGHGVAAAAGYNVSAALLLRTLQYGKAGQDRAEVLRGPA
jgi:hypothetical protein